MAKRILITLIMLALSGTFQLLKSQNKSEQKAQLNVSDAHAITEVNVVMTLQTLNQQVVIPYCDDVMGTIKSLCTLDGGAHLEVLTNQGWRVVKQRKTLGVVGGLPWDAVRSATIPANSNVDLRYKFSRRYFEVEPGQKLRLVIDTWSDEKSMKNREKGIELTSPSFTCPKTSIIP
jgi:hypothetical protein